MRMGCQRLAPFFPATGSLYLFAKTVCSCWARMISSPG